MPVDQVGQCFLVPKIMGDIPFNSEFKTNKQVHCLQGIQSGFRPYKKVLLQPGVFTISLDLKDAYNLIIIREENLIRDISRPYVWETIINSGLFY